ncbi:TonB family protein [Pseudorhodoferax sp.]|uniref:TonB family protein n=1 Tax=Pseudorhodoferax sp. TaxID=1993553 RepID=UPI002DD658FD|nr:TonB family protein [Pseudorhodoferax sp.]
MDFAQQQRQPGKHVVGIGIVIALHLLLGWALVTGLAQRMVEVIKAPIETKIIEEVKPPPPPPPENLPPPPKFAPPPPSFVPPPEVVVNPPPTPAPVITTTTVAPPPAPVVIAPPPPPVAPPPAPPAPPPRVAARPAIANVQACAPSGDDYPAAARRAEATGTTRVRFNVGADGKMASVEVARSAGPSREHKMLDRIAVAKLSECTFQAGRDETGKAVGGSFEVEYVWKLE